MLAVINGAQVYSVIDDLYLHPSFVFFECSPDTVCLCWVWRGRLFNYTACLLMKALLLIVSLWACNYSYLRAPLTYCSLVQSVVIAAEIFVK